MPTLAISTDYGAIPEWLDDVLRDAFVTNADYHQIIRAYPSMARVDHDQVARFVTKNTIGGMYVPPFPFRLDRITTS